MMSSIIKSEEKHYKFWFIFAFIVWVWFVYSAFKLGNIQTSDNPDIAPPDEYEVRGGGS